MQLLGEKVPEKIWKKMVNNVLECDSVENEANLNNLEDGKFYYQDFPSFNPTPGVSFSHSCKELLSFVDIYIASNVCLISFFKCLN